MNDQSGDGSLKSSAERIDTENPHVTVTHLPHDENESERDGKEDELKDTEKPLLKEDENDKLKEIIISEDGEDISGKTTLPVSSKKGYKDIVVAETEVRPSIFTSPFARIKYDWDHSLNVLEFITRVICVVFASIGWIILVGGIPFLSLVQLIVGSVYVHDCPADPRIPEYLIVAGVFGTILHGVSVCTKYAPKSARQVAKVNKQRCLCIEIILQFFLLIWFIAGCCWVYSIYEPDYVNEDRDEYCHKGLYLFAFWLLNITFFTFLLLISVVLCAVAAIAFEKDSPRKTTEVS